METKRTISVLFTILCFLSLNAQEGQINRFKSPNSIQFELGGHGLLYSISYERILINGYNFKTAAQAGIAFYPALLDLQELWLPISLNEILSLGKNHIELGFGNSFVRSSSRDSEGIATSWDWINYYIFRLGYRYQKPDSKFLFRIALTPMVENFPTTTEYELLLSGGISVGYTF